MLKPLHPVPTYLSVPHVPHSNAVLVKQRLAVLAAVMKHLRQQVRGAAIKRQILHVYIGWGLDGRLIY